MAGAIDDARRPAMSAPAGSAALLIAPGATVASVLGSRLLEAVDLRLLVMHVTRLSRIELVTRADQALDAAQAAALSSLLQRRLQGEPVAYLIGEREFYGLMLHVSPAVLIPRPETELLVEQALAHLPVACSGAAPTLLDLGTGSGAVAIALAHARADSQVTATDFSAASLAVAEANAARHDVAVRMRFLQGDWYAALDNAADSTPGTPSGAARFDVIVSNPPYIAAHDVHLAQGDLRFEPPDALTDHADGLAALRRIVDGAPPHLGARGWLLMEHGFDQADAVRALLAARGFGKVQSWRDLAGIERVSGGQWPAGSR